MGIKTTIVVTAVGLWFAHGWYLNTRLIELHSKLDTLGRILDEMRSSGSFDNH